MCCADKANQEVLNVSDHDDEPRQGRSSYNVFEDKENMRSFIELRPVVDIIVGEKEQRENITTAMVESDDASRHSDKDPITGFSDDSLEDRNYEPETGSNDSNRDNIEDFDGDNVDTNFVAGQRINKQEKEQRKSRKRTRQPCTWKLNVAKQKRLMGEEYEGHKKKIKRKKEIGPICNNCKLNCATNILDEVRKNIHESFWKTKTDWKQRRQFLAQSVDVVPIQRRRPRSGSQNNRRQHNYIYNLLDNGIKKKVCKKFFLTTLSISEKMIRNAVQKCLENSAGLVETNQVSNHKLDDMAVGLVREHITLFPKIDSHYSRNKSDRQYLNPQLSITAMYKLYKEWCIEKQVEKKHIVKEHKYREIFSTEFNLHFKPPSIDTCDTCDHLENLKRNVLNDPEAKEEVERTLKEHIEESNRRYKLKKEDKDNLKVAQGEVVAMMDLQKCLPTPFLSNSKTFYLRQLWTFNLTIYCDTLKKSYCFLWDETIAKRGGNEIASCILKFIKLLPLSIKEVTIWSDNCSGQNRNFQLFCMLLWAVQNTHVTVIQQKYLLKGHTHNEADTVHARIEKKKKQLPTMSISVPHEWAQFIRTIPSLTDSVYEMEQHEFFNFKALGVGPGCSFVKRKKNCEKEPFLSSKIVHLMVKKEAPGILYYKTRFEETNFKSVNFNRNARSVKSKTSLKVITGQLLAVDKKKHDNLQELLQWVPTIYHDFYKNIKVKNNDNSDPDDSDDDQ